MKESINLYKFQISSIMLTYLFPECVPFVTFYLCLYFKKNLYHNLIAFIPSLFSHQIFYIPLLPILQIHGFILSVFNLFLNFFLLTLGLIPYLLYFSVFVLFYAQAFSLGLKFCVYSFPIILSHSNNSFFTYLGTPGQTYSRGSQW